MTRLRSISTPSRRARALAAATARASDTASSSSRTVFVQCLRHSAFGSGHRKGIPGLAEFNDAARRRDTVNQRCRNKLPGVTRRLQVRVIAHGPFVCFARFLQITRPYVRMRVKGGDDLRALGSAPRVRRHDDGVASTPRPSNDILARLARK